jgi:hypothetical protein
VTDTRKPFFIVETPYEPVSKVVCYQDTWALKLMPAGRVGVDTQKHAILTLSTPSVIVSGTTNPGYTAFVNQSVLSKSGSPFVVFVASDAKPLPALASLGYRQDFRDIQGQGHEVLWSPLKNK